MYGRGFCLHVCKCLEHVAHVKINLHATHVIPYCQLMFVVLCPMYFYMSYMSLCLYVLICHISVKNHNKYWKKKKTIKAYISALANVRKL